MEMGKNQRDRHCEVFDQVRYMEEGAPLFEFSSRGIGWFPQEETVCLCLLFPALGSQRRVGSIFLSPLHTDAAESLSLCQLLVQCPLNLRAFLPKRSRIMTSPSNENEKGREPVRLTEREEKLIRMIRCMKFGELQIHVSDSQPVRVEEIRTSIKL